MIRRRVTLDEMTENSDGELLATLVNDDGGCAVVPVNLLPDDARVGDVLTITIERDDDESARRRSRIAELQRKLFG